VPAVALGSVPTASWCLDGCCAASQGGRVERTPSRFSDTNLVGASWHRFCLHRTHFVFVCCPQCHRLRKNELLACMLRAHFGLIGANMHFVHTVGAQGRARRRHAHAAARAVSERARAARAARAPDPKKYIARLFLALPGWEAGRQRPAQSTQWSSRPLTSRSNRVPMYRYGRTFKYEIGILKSMARRIRNSDQSLY
jgi:hypothetical protein